MDFYLVQRFLSCNLLLMTDKTNSINKLKLCGPKPARTQSPKTLPPILQKPRQMLLLENIVL